MLEVLSPHLEGEAIMSQMTPEQIDEEARKHGLLQTSGIKRIKMDAAGFYIAGYDDAVPRFTAALLKIREKNTAWDDERKLMLYSYFDDPTQKGQKDQFGEKMPGKLSPEDRAAKVQGGRRYRLELTLAIVNDPSPYLLELPWTSRVWFLGEKFETTHIMLGGEKVPSFVAKMIGAGHLMALQEGRLVVEFGKRVVRNADRGQTYPVATFALLEVLAETPKLTSADIATESPDDEPPAVDGNYVPPEPPPDDDMPF